MLETQSHFQRPKSERHFMRLAEEMRNGTYHYDSFDPIRVTSNGFVIDGQHRLTAMKLTGMTFPLLIIDGYNDEDFLKIDRKRKKRTPGEELKRMGVVNYNQAAAISRILLGYERLAGKSRSATNNLTSTGTDDQVIDCYKQYSKMIDAYGRKGHQIGAFMGSIAILPSVFLICSNAGYEAEEIDAFMVELETGIGTGPAITLRKTLSQDNSRPRKLYNISFRFWLVIQAIDRHLTGSSQRLPRITKEMNLPFVKSAKA